MPVMTCHSTRIVQAPLDRVWDLYSDLHLRPSLFLDIIDYTKPSADRMAEGVTWTEKRRGLRTENNWTVTLLEVRAQKEVRYSVRSELAEFMAVTTFKARGVDTTVELELVGEIKAQSTSKNAVLVITKPLVLHTLQKALDRDLLNLANAAEYGLPERSTTTSVMVTPAPREEPVVLAPKLAMKAAQHDPQDAPTPTLPAQTKKAEESTPGHEAVKSAGNQSSPAAPPQQRSKKAAGQKAQQSKKKKRNAQRKARRQTRT